MTQSKIPGLMLLMVGTLLLVYKVKIVPMYTFFTWSFIFLMIGLTVIATGYLKKNAHVVLVGGILTTISLYVWGCDHVDGWPKHWSVLLFFLGVAIIIMYGINKEPLTMLTGNVLVLTGIFAYPGIKYIPYITPISNILHTYWPVLIIALGITLVLRK